MNITTSRGFAAALVALLTLSVFAGAFAGVAAAEDAQDPVITTDSELDEGDLIPAEDFDPTESPTDEGDYEEVIEVEADNEELELTVEHADRETEHAVLDYTDDVFEVEAEATDTDPGTYTFTLAHEELEDVPMEIEETVTLDVTVTDLASEADETPESTIEVEVENDDERSVVYVDDPTDDDFASYEEDESFFGLFESQDAELDTERDISGMDTDVEVYSGDGDFSDAFFEAADAADDGDRLGVMMGSSLDGDITYVFANEAGETITGDDVDEDDTYVVVNDADERIDVNTGEEFEEEESIDMTLTNDRPGASDLRETLDYDYLESLGGSWGIALPFGMIGTGLLSVAFVAHTRRPAA